MTATLLTVTELREHLETSLSDDALQRLLDADEAEIINRYGPHATATETLPGAGEWIVLERTPVSLTTVSEYADGTTTTLATDDYRVWPAGKLERLNSGTNPRSYWGEVITVTYVPVDASAERRAVLIKLVTLAAQYEGVKSDSVGQGDYSMTAWDYTQERNKLLRSLAGSGQKIWIV